MGHEGAEQLDVDAFDAAREELVDALEDAHGVRDDRVGIGRPEVTRREALQDLVGQTIGGGERQLERGLVGDPAAVEVRGGEALGAGQGVDLGRGAVNEHDTDAERPQQGDVEHDPAEVLLRDDGAIDRDDEGLLAELGDVLEVPRRSAGLKRSLQLGRIGAPAPFS